MRPPILDPTAGERARELRLNPDAPPQIPDPTDPDYGRVPQLQEGRLADAARVVDPTDPACGGTRV